MARLSGGDRRCRHHLNGRRRASGRRRRVGRLEGRSDPAIHGTLLAEALDNASFAVSLFDEDGNYVAVNDRACKLTGYTRSELLAIGPLGVSTADNAHERETFELALTGRVHGGTAQIRRKDGRVVDVDYRIGPTTVGGLPFLIRVWWVAGEAERET